MSGQQVCLIATYGPGTGQYEMLQGYLDANGISFSGMIVYEVAVWEDHEKTWIPDFFSDEPITITLPSSGDLILHNSSMTAGTDRLPGGQTVTVQSVGLFGVVTTAGPASVGVGVSSYEGMVYYDMVEGAPGAKHTMTKGTTFEIIEHLTNGYTKIMIGTTTYLVKTSDLSGRPATTTKAPKTGEPDMSVFLTVILLIGAAGAAYSGRKAVRGIR